MKYIPFIFLILLLSSCSFNDIDFPFKSDGTQINIYLVKDGQVDQSSTNVDLESLDLERTPWLSHSEIKFYDWSSQMFYLKVGKEKEKHSGKYFVLKSGQKPLFLGLFLSSFSSYLPMFPSIIAHDDLFLPSDVVGLGGYGFNENTALLNKNSEFRIAMENSGLLKEGIEADLPEIKKINSTTLEYTFKITNLDLENIYILDPAKMGNSRFHYFTNGVYFSQNMTYYSADNFDYTPSENIDPEWYFKLAPGKSMTRTVKLNGYHSLPSGIITATFNFPGATLNKGEWQKKDGRIWMGSYMVKKELELR
jgi:hypothetical protein